MKTKIPLNFYFVIIATIAVLCLLIFEPILQILFYTIFTFLFLYILLGRSGCIAEVSGSLLIVNYLYPWEKDITVDLSQIIDVDYEKGFYDLISDKTRGGLYVFPKYCADRLIFTIKNGKDIDTILVPVNTRIFQFNKI